MLNRRLLIAFVGLTAFLGGCLRWPGPTNSPRTVALYGGEGGYELIRIPALAFRVELYRLSESRWKPPPGIYSIGGMQAVSGPIALEGDVLKRVSEILSDDASFDWSKPVYPEEATAGPAYAICFIGVKRTIEVLFDLSNNTVKVYDCNSPVAFGRACVDPRASELRTLLRRAER